MVRAKRFTLNGILPETFKLNQVSYKWRIHGLYQLVVVGEGGEVRVILLKNLYLRMVFIGIFIQDRSDVSAIGNLCEKTQRVAKISGGSRIPGGSNL